MKARNHFRAFALVHTVNVGVGELSPVSKSFPRGDGFAFTGRIDHVTIDIGDDALETSPDENLRMVLAMD